MLLIGYLQLIQYQMKLLDKTIFLLVTICSSKWFIIKSNALAETSNMKILKCNQVCFTRKNNRNVLSTNVHAMAAIFTGNSEKLTRMSK